MRRFLAVALVSVVLAGCGSSGGVASTTSEGKKYVVAIMKSYRVSAATKTISAPEARCLARAAIDAAGVDGLDRAKLTPADLDHGSGFATMGKKLGTVDAESVATAIVKAKCLSVGRVLLKSGAAESSAFSRVPPAKVRCIFVTLGAPVAAQRAFADSLLGLPSGDAEFRKAFQDPATTKRALARCNVDPKSVG